MKVCRPNGSLILEVVNVRYKGAEFFWADVRWYAIATKKLFYEEKWLRIPNKAIKQWYRVAE